MTRKTIPRATVGAACAFLALAVPQAGARTPHPTVPQAGARTPLAREPQPGYVPGEVVVGYSSPGVGGRVLRATRLRAASSPAPDTQVLKLPSGQSVPGALARLRRLAGVAYAVPNYLAHVAGASPWIPDDPGRVNQPKGWQRTQWNFLSASGVDAPGAWGNLIADGRPGGRGVIVAVLDTGVAYRNWGSFARSPDFGGTRFIDPHDFVANNAFPLDREGHGTFVTGEIAETTNNNYGLTGLAYGATIMPVRVLAADGSGNAATIARGIRYAVAHGARVINLSIEFGIDIQPGDIPEVLSAVRFAHNHGVLVVGAAGNDEATQLAYPARAYGAVAVGATTRDRCLGWYSNVGPTLALVAPGGGDDASRPGDPNCFPARVLPPLRQLTFPNATDPRRFGYPGGYYGTSMASAEVSATAALLIASGVIGRHPSPDEILRRLEQTATPLGGSVPNRSYGYGLINAAAATS
jgi:serine protease